MKMNKILKVSKKKKLLWFPRSQSQRGSDKGIEHSVKTSLSLSSLSRDKTKYTRGLTG